MEKSVARVIELDELDALAAVGGNDSGAQPCAVTTPACAVIATITVVSITVGCLTTVQEICY